MAPQTDSPISGTSSGLRPPSARLSVPHRGRGDEGEAIEFILRHAPRTARVRRAIVKGTEQKTDSENHEINRGICACQDLLRKWDAATQETKNGDITNC